MLSELVPDIGRSIDVAVGGITDDSREVKAGDLYVAVPGLIHDGRSFIIDAIKRSAAAILCETPAPQQACEIPLLEIDRLREQKGLIASRFYGMPSTQMLMIAVTGTNGKTSCTWFIAQALTALGRRCGVVGTLGFGIPPSLREPGLTTPDAIALQSKLYRLHLENCDAVCIEASSHGLDQGRLNGTAIDMAVFTNITRDHLDYHFSFNAYLQAKKILFRWRGLQVAVINLDDEYATEFIEAVPGSTRVLTFSLRDDRADIHCDALLLRADGFDAEVVTPWGTGSLSSSLLGEFNVSNMLVTLTVLGLLEYDLTQSLARLGEIQTVPGRMDALSAAGFATVVIDYAHTPDALEKALKALRDHCKGELWCVVGCGGDRDAGKRPLMGRIASTVADRLILTSDNPRGEHPQKIINDILQGIDRETVTLTVESDRRRAIRMAVGQAVAGDIVLVAGKGHEDYQEVGQRRIPYSDYDEVRAAFGEVSGRS